MLFRSNTLQETTRISLQSKEKLINAETNSDVKSPKAKLSSTKNTSKIKERTNNQKDSVNRIIKKKGNKSKFKRFYGTEGERGIQQKSKLIGSGIKERKLTKKGTKKRIAKAEQNLKDI